MGYGHLDDAQKAALAPFVKGKKVHDLGSGDLVLSHVLVEMGARRVFAIDKDHDYSDRTYRKPGSLRTSRVSARIHTHTASFREILGRRGRGVDGWPEVAFLSWPINSDDPFRDALVRAAPVAVYLGKNLDGTACGSPDLLKDLCHRELLAHVPGQSGPKNNTLIVVGKAIDTPREPVLEEVAGISGFLLYQKKVGGSDVELARLLAHVRLGLLSKEDAMRTIATRADHFTLAELGHLVDVGVEMQGLAKHLRDVQKEEFVSNETKSAARGHEEALAPRIASLELSREALLGLRSAFTEWLKPAERNSSYPRAMLDADD